MAKKRPKFSAVSDNFQLWSRISPEMIDNSTYRKSGNCFINYTLPRWVKKIGELWSTNKNSMFAHIDQPLRSRNILLQSWIKQLFKLQNSNIISNNATGRFHYAQISSQIFWKYFKIKTRKNVSHVTWGPWAYVSPLPHDRRVRGSFHRLWQLSPKRLTA